MSKSKSERKSRKPRSAAERGLHCMCCPEPRAPGRTRCAKHIAEKDAAIQGQLNSIIQNGRPPEPKPVEQIRTFADDWRVKNPKLHNFYVRGAYEDLKIAEEAARTLEARARVPCAIMAGALRQAMREEIERSAAFFEAAALLFAGHTPPKAPPEEA